MIPRLRTVLLAAAAAATLLPAAGHAQYFGRNKVQYRSFDFQVIETEHFDVHYYERERTAAMDAARMIERSYARLSRILEYEFQERKPLIVYASHTDFQQTNALGGFIGEGTGGVTESLKERMILPFTGSYADFDHVLTHELVHGFQYDVLFGSGVMSAGAPMAVRLPLWFMEGMAEYLSVGVIDPLTQAWLRDAVLTGYFRSIGEMSVRDDYLSYRFGQSLWAYIGDKWGDEVVGILLQKAPRVGVERAFETTLGLTLPELSREWQAEVRATYIPQVAEYTRPGEIATRLTRHEEVEDPWFLAPAMSPDGSQLVYLTQEDSYAFDLVLADGRTGKPVRKLISSAGNADFESLRYLSSSAAFSPDGRYVAFAAQTGGRDALYIYDLRRRRVWKKLRFELDAVLTPSWAPDGRKLVFTGLDGGISDLFVTDLEGRLERLTNDRFADLLPAWSPDGRTIAFSTDRGPDADLSMLRYGNLRVGLLDVAGGTISLLPHQEEGKNINPQWSPDGTELAWVSDRTGKNDLYLFDLASATLERASDFLSGVMAVTPTSPVLSWSRSGRLAFTYFETAGYNTYVVEDVAALPRFPVAPPAHIVLSDDAPPAPEAPPAAGTPPDSAATPPDSVATPHTPVSWGGAPPDTGAAALAAGFRGSFYRSAAGVRPSERLPPGRRAAAPVSVVALLDSSALALPDTATFGHRDYGVELTADYVGRPSLGAQFGGYGGGLYGGSYIQLSDMLGNHNLLLAGNLSGSLSDASFLGVYQFLRRRADLGVAVAQQPYYAYLGGGVLPLDINGTDQDVVANVFMRTVYRQVQGMVSYPFSTFRRVELGLSGVHYARELLYRGYLAESREQVSIDETVDSDAYLRPSIAAVFDNTIFGWTGPVHGRRYRMQAARTMGDLSVDELFTDFRNYASWNQKLVLATRFMGLLRTGDASERYRNYWGGPYYLRGYDGGSFQLGSGECEASRALGTGGTSVTSCPARDQLIGSSVLLANVELRYPVIQELQIGFIGNFPPVDAVAFFDAGVAWDERACLLESRERPGECAPGQEVDIHLKWQRGPADDPYLVRTPLASYGVGLRLNVFYAILRLDYAVPIHRPGVRGPLDGRFSLSFGESF
ncbi:MAG: BamA/TamA family outer membrane protein [Gemmatimonadota bacterium]